MPGNADLSTGLFQPRRCRPRLLHVPAGGECLLIAGNGLVLLAFLHQCVRLLQSMGHAFVTKLRIVDPIADQFAANSRL